MPPKARSRRTPPAPRDKAITPFLAVQMVRKGISVKQVASAGCVHPSTVRRWTKWDEQGRSLDRKPGSGAVAKLSAAETSQLKKISEQPEYRSASKAARAFADITGKSISKSTAWRALTSGGDRFWLSKVRPKLTSLQRQYRITFSNVQADRAWDSVMFTDSKYFQLDSHSRRHGTYGKQPKMIEKPKFGPSLHLYMGLTRYGMTELKVVSGGSTKNSTFIDKKGKLYKGVSAAEYQAEVLPMFMREGKRLYRHTRYRRDWILQQDGAPSHRGGHSRNLAASSAPGGLLPDWPPNSPDLSLIENIWGIMAQRLSFLPQSADIEDYMLAIEAARDEIKPVVLQNMFEGMSARLQKCLDLNGAIITK